MSNHSPIIRSITANLQVQLLDVNLWTMIGQYNYWTLIYGQLLDNTGLRFYDNVRTVINIVNRGIINYYLPWLIKTKTLVHFKNFFNYHW